MNKPKKSTPKYPVSSHITQRKKKRFLTMNLKYLHNLPAIITHEHEISSPTSVPLFTPLNHNDDCFILYQKRKE